MTTNANKHKGVLLATAVATLFTSGVLLAQEKGGASEAMVKCTGVNACKGKGECASAANACKGQNACKGKGFVSLSAADCKAKGGAVME